MLNDHVTVTFPHKDGINRDAVVNTFTFHKATDMTDTDMGLIENAIRQFLNSTPSDGTAVGEPSIILGPQLSRTAVPVFRHYNIDAHLSGTTPVGSPVRTNTMTEALHAPVSGFPMPSEVAICLSFHGTFGADQEFAGGTRPKSRDRGRIYFGPLVGSALVVNTEGTTNRPIVAPNVRAALLSNALDHLMAPGSGISQVVWSRRAGSVNPVEGYSVDDAFDTQRRRGERPTVRQSVGSGV
jgi:hypothetical protein